MTLQLSITIGLDLEVVKNIIAQIKATHNSLEEHE